MTRTGAAQTREPGQHAVVVRSGGLVVADAGLGLLRRSRAAGQHAGIDDLGQRLGRGRGRDRHGGLLEAALHRARGQQLGEVLRADAAVDVLLATGLVAAPPGQRGSRRRPRVAGSSASAPRSGRSASNIQAYRSPSRRPMRFGGVLVRIRMLSAVNTPRTTSAPMSVISSARGSPSIHPNTPPASLSAGRPCARLRASAADVAEARDREDEQREADADPAVVMDGCRMPEEPAGEDEQQHGQDEGDPADEPACRVGADVRRDLVADEEPFVDRAGDRQQHEQERQPVAPLILLEGLRAESAEQSPGAVRETHPGADDERRLLALADVALRRRSGLAGAGRRARRRCVRGRATTLGRACAPGHPPTLRRRTAK